MNLEQIEALEEKANNLSTKLMEQISREFEEEDLDLETFVSTCDLVILYMQEQVTQHRQLVN